ncbi:MAG: hypothetical protein U0263_21070 [Polyangiaceae bacterium]
MKKRIIRDLSTAETQAFWASAERIAAQAEAWPASKRAGINVAETRAAPPDEAGVAWSAQTKTDGSR